MLPYVSLVFELIICYAHVETQYVDILVAKRYVLVECNNVNYPHTPLMFATH